jgi:hypothetical protein
MNKGIDLATGDWINFMNSGDMLYNNNTIMKVIKHLDDCDIFYGDLVKDIGTIKSPINLTHFLFLREISICHQAIFSTKMILHRYPFDTNYRLIADRKFLMQCFFTHVKTKYSSDVICVYDMSGISSDVKAVHEESNRLVFEYYGYFGLYVIKIKRLIGILFKSIMFTIKRTIFLDKKNEKTSFFL